MKHITLLALVVFLAAACEEQNPSTEKEEKEKSTEEIESSEVPDLLGLEIPEEKEPFPYLDLQDTTGLTIHGDAAKVKEYYAAAKSLRSEMLTLFPELEQEQLACDEEHSIVLDGFEATSDYTEIGAVDLGEYSGCTEGKRMFLCHSIGYCVEDGDLYTDKYWLGDRFELKNGLKAGMSREEVRAIFGDPMNEKGNLMVYCTYDQVENYDFVQGKEAAYKPGVVVRFMDNRLTGIYIDLDFIC